jgi:hypothetical protein
LAVGSSLTVGSGVSGVEAWLAQLQQLTGPSVNNAGEGGYRADQIILLGEQLLPPFQPRVLVVDLIPAPSSEPVTLPPAGRSLISPSIKKYSSVEWRPPPSTRRIQYQACSGRSCRSKMRFPSASRNAFPLSPGGRRTARIGRNSVNRRGKYDGKRNGTNNRRDGRRTLLFAWSTMSPARARIFHRSF